MANLLCADMAMMTSAPLANASLPIVFHQMDLSVVQGQPLLSHPEFTMRALATQQAPGVFLFEDLMPEHEQTANAYWQTIIRPLNIGSGLLCVARTPEDNQKPVIFTFHRRVSCRPFGRAEVEVMWTLLPHLRRSLAVTLDAPPSQARCEAHDFCSNIGAPAFFFGPDARVVDRNAAADLLLNNQDGLMLRDARLVLSDQAAQPEFDAAVWRVIGENWTRKLRLGSELIARRQRSSPMVLVLTPLGTENPIAQWAAPVRCVLFVLEEELRASGSLTNRLTRLYGLTLAEAEIAIGIATGASTRELAQLRGTQAATVRSQIKAVMAKTSARRQSEVAAKINRLRL
jgi:DNA-binding CsgD family transcriptional regulator